MFEKTYEQDQFVKLFMQGELFIQFIVKHKYSTSVIVEQTKLTLLKGAIQKVISFLHYCPRKRRQQKNQLQ